MAMWTYFISDGEAIKIGRSNDVFRRLFGLQTANSRELTLLAWLSGDHEMRLHKHFSEDRIHGEWFSSTEGLKSFMEEVTRRAPSQRLGSKFRNRSIFLDIVDEVRKPLTDSERSWLAYRGFSDFFIDSEMAVARQIRKLQLIAGTHEQRQALSRGLKDVKRTMKDVQRRLSALYADRARIELASIASSSDIYATQEAYDSAIDRAIGRMVEV